MSLSISLENGTNEILHIQEGVHNQINEINQINQINDINRIDDNGNIINSNIVNVMGPNGNLNIINNLSNMNNNNIHNNNDPMPIQDTPERTNEMINSDMNDINNSNQAPQGFPQFPQPQEFAAHPMMWNNQFIPPGSSMGPRPNGAPPFPFGVGIPAQFPPYQNFSYRMKPNGTEMGGPYNFHENLNHDGSPFNKSPTQSRAGKNVQQSGVKYRHNESEQRRRDKINHHFDELKLLLPSHRNNKSAILEAAIEYIKKYQVQIQQLEKLNLDIARENNDIIQVLAQVNDFNQRRLETQ